MADFSQIVTALREQMNATLSRSDVLKPLAWLVGLAGTALVGSVGAGASAGIVSLMSILFAICVALYGGSYIYCLIYDRDALRSERYTLQKMAIEHGLLGDNLTGLFKPPSDDGVKRLEAQATVVKTERNGG